MNKLHPDTLPFLQELTVNNNRPWFNDHKDRWLAIKADFEAFTQALIVEMEKYDDTLVGLTAKNSAASTATPAFRPTRLPTRPISPVSSAVGVRRTAEYRATTSNSAPRRPTV